MSSDTRLRVAYAGAPGSFAEDAVLATYPQAETVPVPMFADVPSAVEAGDVAAGVLPIENVVGGGVREVYDRLEDIVRVYSHIQALTQAEPFLRSRDWTLLAATNTAGAGREIAKLGERGSAAVLSPRAADIHGLSVLAEDIQVERRNRTRFLVLALPQAEGLPTPASALSDGSRRSALAFSVRNEPGTLVFGD